MFLSSFFPHLQKQKIPVEKGGMEGVAGDLHVRGDASTLAKFTIGPDDDSDGSGRGRPLARMEVPMGEEETADLLAENVDQYTNGLLIGKLF